eukprot:GDKJ01017848.1.p1 GENE.GDKJ01017848.1~~GDKJ01017848.1.p1  ORF type:complete len:631 (+),score=128.84 GDKJ01017848.1:51-1943(+)
MNTDNATTEDMTLRALESTLEESGHPFKILSLLGEGTFAVVYKAKNTVTGELVSLKHIRVDASQAGVAATALREIAILSELQHPNIIRLRDMIFTKTGNVLYVYDLMDGDLRKFRNRFKDPLYDPELLIVREIMRQILCGVATCHSRGVIHRDIKPHNILINSDLTVKVADFGLARNYTLLNRPMTREVITLWYRAPELLLGIDKYTTAVDIWSIGCVFFELVLQIPPFAGDSEWGTLMSIFTVCGTPNKETWPGVEHLKNYSPVFPNFKHTLMEKMLSCNLYYLLGPLAVDLIVKMLKLNPDERISAQEALQHDFFKVQHPLEGLTPVQMEHRALLIQQQVGSFLSDNRQQIIQMNGGVSAVAANQQQLQQQKMHQEQQQQEQHHQKETCVQVQHHHLPHSSSYIVSQSQPHPQQQLHVQPKQQVYLPQTVANEQRKLVAADQSSQNQSNCLYPSTQSAFSSSCSIFNPIPLTASEKNIFDVKKECGLVCKEEEDVSMENQSAILKPCALNVQGAHDEDRLHGIRLLEVMKGAVSVNEEGIGNDSGVFIISSSLSQQSEKENFPFSSQEDQKHKQYLDINSNDDISNLNHPQQQLIEHSTNSVMNVITNRNKSTHHFNMSTETEIQMLL